MTKKPEITEVTFIELNGLLTELQELMAVQTLQGAEALSFPHGTVEAHQLGQRYAAACTEVDKKRAQIMSLCVGWRITGMSVS